MRGAIRGHQRSLEVIRGHQRSSEVIRGYQTHEDMASLNDVVRGAGIVRREKMPSFALVVFVVLHLVQPTRHSAVLGTDAEELSHAARYGAHGSEREGSSACN